MMLMGVDYHPSFQTIAFLMEETGECGEQELNHSDGQAEKFYRDLKQRGICVRVGMEATRITGRTRSAVRVGSRDRLLARRGST
jgi:hypothetical protein